MKKLSYKVGDELRIIGKYPTDGRATHHFINGTRVRVEQVDEGDKSLNYYCESLDEPGLCYWVRELEAERIIISTVEVRLDFVKQAYDAACPEWKKKIEDAIPAIKDLVVKYQIGNVFEYDRDRYILSQVSFGGESFAQLTNVQTGGLWHYAQKVKSLYGITSEELNRITNGHAFKHIK